jgi:hypothetical protein
MISEFQNIVTTKSFENIRIQLREKGKNKFLPNKIAGDYIQHFKSLE